MCSLFTYFIYRPHIRQSAVYACNSDADGRAVT